MKKKRNRNFFFATLTMPARLDVLSVRDFISPGDTDQKKNKRQNNWVRKEKAI